MDTVLKDNASTQTANTKRFKGICVTSDLLKVDNRQADRMPNPQRINIDWIETLIAAPISSALGGLHIQKQYGDEGNARTPRWTFYSQCGLPFDSASWAFLYEGTNAIDKIERFLDEHFSDDELVLCFEGPDYLINYLSSHNISYIDFNIHPIRFLPDYMFGIRTNVARWREKLAATSIPDAVIRDFARVSSARTMRVYRGSVPPQGSALFLGQIEIDSSLIHQGALANLADVEQALLSLSKRYPRVFYKVHPHMKDHKKIKEVIGNISNCRWIDVNIYDAFACRAFDMIGTLSSGGAIEARYFGCNSHWFLDRKDYTDKHTKELSKRYYPIYQSAIESDFWKYLLDDEQEIASFKPTWPKASQGAFKFSLNQKWGR